MSRIAKMIPIAKTIPSGFVIGVDEFTDKKEVPMCGEVVKIYMEMAGIRSTQGAVGALGVEGEKREN